ICLPNADSLPVIGPATATGMSCASAAVESANEAPNARPISFSEFMDGPRGDRYFFTTRPSAGSVDRRYCRLILPPSHRQISGNPAIPSPHLAAVRHLAPAAAFQIGGADFRPLQQLATGSG